MSDFNKDPDRFDSIEEWMRGFLRQVDQAGPEARELAAIQQRQQQYATAMEEFRRSYIPKGKQERSGLGKLLFGGGAADGTQLAMPAAQLSQKTADLSQQTMDINEESRVALSAYDTALSEMLN